MLMTEILPDPCITVHTAVNSYGLKPASPYQGACGLFCHARKAKALIDRRQAVFIKYSLTMRGIYDIIYQRQLTA